MAYSYVRYTGNGSTTNYTFSFPYINSSHIKVRLNGVLTTAFTFLNTSTLQFTSAPANGVIIEIRRETPKDSAIVNFTDGSVLLERDLDLLATYDLYLAQETQDAVDSSISQTSLGVFDAQNKRITNVADPVSAQDAVTKAYADTVITQAQVQANAASASAAAAAGSASAAATTYDAFDDRYLGSKASPPAVDNDGNALLVGAVYWDTGSNQMFTWDGSAWKPTFVTGNTVRSLVVATAGQTVVAAPTYVIGNNSLQVYLNGVKQVVTSDYTETSQSSITFASGLTVGDEVELIAFQAYPVGTTSAQNVSWQQSGTGSTSRTVDLKLKELVSIKDFGAVGDGVTDDQTAALNWLAYIAANNKSGFVPAGVYLLGAKISITGCNKIAIYGEGSTVSIFKRADNIISGSFTEMFSFSNQAGGMSEIVVKGIGFDGNARGNQIPVSISGVSGTFQVGEKLVGKDCTIGAVSATQLKFTRYRNALTAAEVITGATSGATATVTATVDAFVWQQSHCVRLNPSGTLGWNRAEFDDIWATDPTADVLGFGGNATNTYGHLNVTNMFVQERNRVRSDITVTGSYQTLRITNCKTVSTEVELNGYDPAGDQSTVINNLITEVLDLAAEGTDDTTGWPPLVVSNSIINQFGFLLGFSGQFNNCQFLLSDALRPVKGKWKFNACKLLARSDLSIGASSGLIYSAASGTNMRSLEVNNCVFEYESGASLTYYFYDANSWGSGSTSAYCTPFVFANCLFKGTAVSSAYLRGGKFEFNKCTHEVAGDAIFHTTLGSITDSELRLFDNVVVNSSGWLWYPPTAYTTGPLKIWMRGNISTTLGQVINFSRYDKIAAPHGSAVASNDVLYFKLVDREYESNAAPTTGKWLKGSVIWNSAPAPSGKVGWAVTTSGTAGSGAVFKPFGAIDA